MNLILLPSDTQTEHCITEQSVIKHLLNVLKIQVGDRVKVGVLYGNIGTATIEKIEPNAIILSQIDCQNLPPPKLNLTVILAIPRPKVLRRLVLDMTAMGVTKLILVNSYRSEKSYWQSPFLAKIDDYIIEGLQQACDTVPLQVDFKKRLKPFVEDELSGLIKNKQAIVAHPYADSHFSQVWQNDRETLLIIGAEGGWIAYEVDLFKKVGCEVASLGTRILRTENVVSVLCGQVLITTT